VPRTRANGVELYYELQGQGKETVIFANGVLGTTAGWLPQMHLFSKKYRILLYDGRNQGRSDKPSGDCTLDLHAEDLSALMAELKIGRAHIVGVSYGGEIGMTMGIRYPERVQSLVISNSVSQIDPLLEAKIEAWLMAARLKDAKLFFQVSAPDIFSEEFIRKNPSFMRMIEEQYAKLDYDAVIRLIARFREFNITAELAQIRVPALVIASEKDTLKPVKYSELIHKKIADSELFVVSDAGHALTYEKPQEFNTLVLGFLAKQELAQAG